MRADCFARDVLDRRRPRSQHRPRSAGYTPGHRPAIRAAPRFVERGLDRSHSFDRGASLLVERRRPRGDATGTQQPIGALRRDDRCATRLEPAGAPAEHRRRSRPGRLSDLCLLAPRGIERGTDRSGPVPAFTRADDELNFKQGDIHIREIVKYEDYKRFGSHVKILYNGKELPPGEKKPDGQAPPPNPPQKQ